jgi:hypothetical protein
VSIARLAPALVDQLRDGLSQAIQDGRLRKLIYELRPRVSGVEDEDDRILALMGAVLGIVSNNAGAIVNQEAQKLEALNNRLIGKAELLREIAAEQQEEVADERDADSGPQLSG